MKKIYLEQPYKNTLSTRAIPVEGKENTYIPEETIVLAPTPHYQGELGLMNGTKVSGEHPEIILETEEPLSISITRHERLQFLQDSSARILLTVAFSHLLEAQTLNWFIGEDSYLDLNVKDLSFLALDKVEDLTNYLLQGNFLLKTGAYDDEKTEISIGQYPKVEHYGPILKRTGEISLIKITDLEKLDDRIRVHYLSGAKAFERYRQDETLLKHLRMLYRVEENGDILKAAKRTLFAKDSLAEDNKKMQEELGIETMNEYLKMATTLDGRHYIFRVLKGINFRELKYISAKIMDRPNYVQIYGIPNGTMAQVLVCVSKNLNLNVKTVLDDLKDKYPVTGGGNLYRIQANCPTEHLSNVMDAFLITLKNKEG